MIAVEMYYVRFLDSFQFLSASLETLADNLAKSCDTPYSLFTHTRNHFKNRNISDEKVLFAKGVFPYEYFNSLDKFGETCLPPKDAFYSSWKEDDISDDDYERAQNVWKEFDCKTLKDYHDH